jgi:nitronate monooxygenase
MFLGCDLPIVQAPMAGSQGSPLAIAVCGAGGLGSLPCAMLTPDAMRKELAAITAATSRPYNVNFFSHQQPTPDPARTRAWLDLLAPYFTEYGIDPQSIVQGPGRAAFNTEAAEILEEFKPPVVSFHFGLPSDDLVARVKSWGSTIIASATTVDEARYLEAHGADAVIAQGSEAGGHRSMFLTADVATQVPTLTLVRQIVAAVGVPVIAAGGIADASGVAKALAAGAVAAQAGTAYLFCPEATPNPLHRAALASDAARTTAITNLFTGRPARSIVNRLMREVGPINPAAPQFPLAASAIMALRAKAEPKGVSDFTSLWAGESARLCKAMPAAELTRQLAQQR